ncbi:family 16 glycosylhydrolase [Mesorhizobium sp. YM1C-6-2]|uniref:family 16 glycosylhydrolase n=1 Tax=Mesorhizobium sp. YM1C-6-2 TaxID=1827501 RepID=UPI000EF22CEE|nr:family 16 glycosylhydrolase [Mesorhizobium sp. YM1C-6-2]RLP28261.1 glycosyl hydrolase family protein [Mesorhizobium sp. YM1C-6-2]
MATDVSQASTLSTSRSFIFGTSGADTIAGTAGADIIYGRAGSDVLSGDAEADMFVVRRGEGSDTITDFQAGSGGDILRLQNYGLSDFAAFKAASVQSGADLSVTLPNGETLTLTNVDGEALLPENLKLDQPLPVSGAPTAWNSTYEPGSTLEGTAENDQLAGSNPDITLVGGMGDDTYIVWDHTNTVVEEADAGIDTISTYGVHGYSLASAPNVENLTLLGGETSSARGNSLANIITGNSASNLIDGGGADDVLIGGGGRDTFVIRQGEGSDTIMDFEAGQRGDTVALADFGFENFAAVKSALHQVGSDAILDLGDGSILTFRNSQTADFSANNFSLAVDTASLVQTFNDDFNELDRFSDGDGTWRTRFEWWGDGAFTLAQNGERQIYVDTDFRGLTNTEQESPLGYNPFSIEDGKLVITAEPIADPSAATKHFDYTSGMISTHSSFSQTYGYFEITAELPKEPGTWPAFWMLPVDNGWPPEIDILEAYGDISNQVHTAVIGTGGTTDTWAQVDTSEGSHSYGMMWTPYEITFYVDGVKTSSVATPTELHDPMYMMANLAIGGLAGNPDPALVAQFSIDNIAAYQLPEYTLDQYTLRQSGAHTRYIEGTYGPETLQGTSGNDFLNGRAGADSLIGGAGDDTYNVNDRTAKVYENFDGGIDTIRASVSYALPANVENLYLVGNDGWNGAKGNDLPNIIVGNGGGNTITGGRGNDILTGGAGPDTFVFSRGDGSDIITDFQAGPGRTDVVKLVDYGFSTFEEVQAAMTQSGDDIHLALDGFETLVFRGRQISDFAADDFLLPDIPPESLAWIRANIGTEGADTMLGSASNERFEGKGNADTYSGGMGDDTYLVDNAEQQVVERPREGIDTVEAYISYALPDNVENLKLLNPGTSGTGNDLANRITGSEGSDVLNGLGGDDYLVGGRGADVFVFERGNGSDTVADFSGSATEEGDTLRFVGYGPDAYLTNVEDNWTIHYSGGEESFHLSGVTSLSQTDYVFA